MKKIGISADSAIDTQEELLKKYNIHVIPYTVVLGEKEVKDVGIDANDLYKFVKETGKLPKTTAINPAQFYMHFENLLKEYDYVIHFNLTSTFSSTYNNAVQASKEFEGRVFVIDSKTFSVGILLECIYARQLIDCGKYDVQTIVDKIEKRKVHIKATCLMETTEYIYKGGRCNAFEHLSCKLLGLRPLVIYNQKDLKVAHIFRGKYQTVCRKYVKEVLNMFPNQDKSLAVISGTIVDDGIMDIICENVKTQGEFKDYIITHCNATIATYGGKNALGFGYWDDGGLPDDEF